MKNFSRSFRSLVLSSGGLDPCPRGDPLGGPEVQDQTFGDLGSGRLAEGEW